MGYLEGLFYAWPEILLFVATLVVLLADLFLNEQSKLMTYMLAQAAIFATVLLLYGNFAGPSLTALGETYVHDYLASSLKIVLLLLTSLILIYSRRYWQEQGVWHGEFFVLVLFAVLGCMIIISGKHLLLLYLGLELLSLSVYALVAIQRDNARATEAAMKYFVLGAIASGLLLYGMSLLYGLTHALDMNTISSYVASNIETKTLMTNIPLLFALVFVVAGLAFKFGVVPFHMWIPDVYHGAPTIVTVFIASVPKLAAFAFFVRLMVQGLGDASAAWGQMFLALGLLSVIFGNVVAIAQTNLKRMFAYSTIAHMGFVVLAFVASGSSGYSAAMFYSIVYAIMSAGGFAMLLLLSRNGIEAENLTDLKGLNERSPWFAFIMLLILFSMAGIPPLAGFYAKLAVINAVVNADMVWVALIMVVMSVIGAFYYLRAIKMMYFDAPEHSHAIVAGAEFKLALSVNGLLLIVLGIFPNFLMTVCMMALDVSRIRV